MPFGQLVIGPPGSGKTTYCLAMQQFCSELGRPCFLVNLDPANEVNHLETPYDPLVDVQDLISIETVMEELHLGPNGALVYAMEYLQTNIDWLQQQLAERLPAALYKWKIEKMRKLIESQQHSAGSGRQATEVGQDDEDEEELLLEQLSTEQRTQFENLTLDACYLLFDCPGQIELYTNHDCVRLIAEALQKPKVSKQQMNEAAPPPLHFRLCSVHLVDSYYCSDPALFLSVLMVSLSTMVKLELPHVNVLSKVDLIEQMGHLDFDIDYYTDVQDLSYLLRKLEMRAKGSEADQDEGSDDGEDEENEPRPALPAASRFAKLNKVLADVIQDYGLVSFCTLNINEKKSMYKVLRVVDKASGYVFGSMALENDSIREIIHDSSEGDWDYNRNDDVRSKLAAYQDDDEDEDDEEEYPRYDYSNPYGGSGSHGHHHCHDENCGHNHGIPSIDDFE